MHCIILLYSRVHLRTDEQDVQNLGTVLSVGLEKAELYGGQRMWAPSPPLPPPSMTHPLVIFHPWVRSSYRSANHSGALIYVHRGVKKLAADDRCWKPLQNRPKGTRVIM
jgi:hypothetical protein